MAEFKVDTNQLRAYSNQIGDLQRQMNDVAARMTGLQIGSVLQIKASTALIGRITDCKWATINQAFNLGKLARGLDDVADLYERTENNLKEPKTAEEAAAQAEQEQSSWNEAVPEWLRELIGAWGDSVDAVLDGNPVCTFLSMVLNWYGNLDEFNGDMTNPRFWLETIGETAADVALGAIATIIAAAVGLSGGTAVVAAVVAVWAAKLVVQLITGESAGEQISDGFIDIGEVIGELIGGAIYP